MLLLVTLVLVVVSAVLLVLGFVQDALGFIYLSMLCAGVAALALFVFARLARRRSAVLAASGLAAATRSAGRPDAGVGWTPASDRVAPGQEERTAEQVATDFDGELSTPARGRGAEPANQGAGAEDGAYELEDWGDEVVFPIEGYDDLRVSDILPLLSALDADELQEVRNRELAGKARATVLDRIDDRLGRGSRTARSERSPAAPRTGRAGGSGRSSASAGKGPDSTKRSAARNPGRTPTPPAADPPADGTAAAGAAADAGDVGGSATPAEPGRPRPRPRRRSAASARDSASAEVLGGGETSDRDPLEGVRPARRARPASAKTASAGTAGSPKKPARKPTGSGSATSGRARGEDAPGGGAPGEPGSAPA